ncbi:response regulator transcription factor [Streptomyces xanthophaeus]|uniref:DNA-binding response regulator n=1 Tax=Streptomyces xanthophaeus TaxID=67385 RepID=A0A919H308_9ACTN|nr:response regulator transcription factor [Streptomyces xanthophaeus]WCD90106.1 Transcriptional regulatory protein DesR [Streptomyces xanthophaeus]WST26103.1 response regulator transcription factor [Streptomyces xanthophaeus]WST58922.1 response regulator transcription factor [Streptomyces xanthophaeus]GHI85778.1 DNA-binding response regulator [Streptomyces xanthophaeus]
MTKVLVLHSTSLVRSALAALLRCEGDFDVTSAGWRTAARQAEYLRPDVAVVDLDCPGATALLSPDGRAARAALAPATRLLVLATSGTPGPLRRAFQAQALGYVDKDGSPGRLVRAIRKLAAGERFVDASLASALMEADPMPLSPRELSVLARAAEGDSVAEIARALHLASGTVRNYMAAATRKTGARNRIDAIRISRRAGWV